MDQSDSLEALSNLLNQIADNPHDFSLHVQHVKLALSLEGMDAEAQSALETMTGFYAVGDEVWLSLIKAKESGLDLTSKAGVEELLELYERAENDYLSIKILERHADFVLEHYERYTSEEQMKPAELEEIFSDEWTREQLGRVSHKGAKHLSRSYVLFDKQRDWELERLEAASEADKIEQVLRVEMLLETRLRQPHSNSEETLQAYSSFTTRYKPASEYEKLLVSASQTRAKLAKAYDRRDRLEMAVSSTNNSLEALGNYVLYERRAKYPDLFVMAGVYERAIAEAAKQRFDGVAHAEEALTAFWVGYCDALRLCDAGEALEEATLKRALRSVPGSGEIWARYIRQIERFADSEKDTVEDVYGRAFATNLLKKDVEQTILVVLARAGYERRRLASGTGDEDTLATMIVVLESGIESVRNASPTGDPRFRLEKFLAELYNAAGMADSANTLWQETCEHYKNSYLAWTTYTDALVKSQAIEDARKVFSEQSLQKEMDWPEAIWEAWVLFEHSHGSVEQLENCLDRIEKGRQLVQVMRYKQAESLAYHNRQVEMEAQATSTSVAEVPVPAPVTNEQVMDVDVPVAPTRGIKRSAEETESNTNKKPKLDEKPALKRDRENCTVFVSDLPNDVTDDNLKTLFKDCGRIREIKITTLPQSVVATVEFMERESVPGALTKDKKRVRDQEVGVHLAWQSTLYITNFPEVADDAYIRNLFGSYGNIFDVRWPSKKFKSTRRFCYLQYSSPKSAQAALELHGRELEPGQSMNVFISNPERKKDRSDQDANEREVYVAGLSKFTTKDDLEKLFRTYGPIKEVRITLDDKGHAKGFGFVEFDSPDHARASLAANNHELKNRRLAVTLCDARVRARTKHTAPETGLGRKAELRSRSVRVRNLPAGVQEGLLQQALEKLASVKRVELFEELHEAVVELESAAEAGKLLLRSEPVVFDGQTLELSEEGAPAKKSAPAPNATGAFVPRKAGSKPRAGLGARKPVLNLAASGSIPASKPSAPSTGKGQDDFRKLLG